MIPKPPILSDEELGNIEWTETSSIGYAADFSFFDDYPKEVRRMLEFQRDADYQWAITDYRAKVLKEVGEERLSEGDIQLLIVVYNFKASQYGEDLSELIKASERRFKENLEALSGTMPERSEG